MDAEEKREGFLEKYIFELAGVIILVLGVFLYPAVRFLWRYLTGHELPGKPGFSVQNLVAALVMLFAAAFAWYLHKRKVLQLGIDSWAFDIRVRALKSLESGWITLFLEPSIEGEKPIRLPLRLAPSYVEHPGVEEATTITEGHGKELPPGTSINEVLDKSRRSLLVLGKPGSGKTTLLLQLSKYLHGLATQDQSQPIPIFLRLAKWNRWLGVLSGERAFERWLIRQMKLDYLIDKDLGRKWLRAGKIVLLLDGLDEVASAKARRSCHQAIRGLISRFHGGLVVSSRIEGYPSLNRLPLDVAVEALPATEPQVLQYLSTAASASKLTMALTSDPGAITVLTSPFALTLALATYSDNSKTKPPPEGKFRIPRLLDDFVRSQISIHLKESKYKKDAFLRWMRNLAQCSKLGKQVIFDPVELREKWLSGAWQHAACKVAVILAVTVFCFTAEAVLWFIYFTSIARCSSGGTAYAVPCVPLALRTNTVKVFLNTVPGNLILAAIQGAIAACVLGFPVGVFGSMFQLRPVRLAPAGFLSSRVRQSLRVFVVASAGICAALTPIGLILQRYFTHNLAPTYSRWDAPLSDWGGPVYAQLGYSVGFALKVKNCVLIGLCVGFLLALTTFLSAEANSSRSLSSAVRSSIAIALSFGVITGILLWLFVPEELIVNLTRAIPGFINKPDIPFGGALLVVLAAGGLFTIRYYVTRLMMVITRCGPWRFERFLDLATECGFLRPVSGPDRIFRHPMLRDYFTSPSPRKRR